MMAWFALFGIPILAMLLVLRNRAHPQALSTAIIGGWLFMPLVSTKVSGLPELNKGTLLATSVLMAAIASRPETLGSLRPRWYDIPIACWCATPMLSSLANDLGPYDGYIACAERTMVWGAPYVLGRAFFIDPAAFKAMANALLLGAAIYAPLCLLESRLAPQLHSWVFGVAGRANWELVPFYGPLRFKASVFLETPLELTLLMGFGFLSGYWLLRHRLAPAINQTPRVAVTALALVSTLMGKSLGGVTLTLTGLATLLMRRRLTVQLMLSSMMLVAPAYIIGRSTGLWSGSQFVAFLNDHISAARAHSFNFRMLNEDLLLEKAMQHPLLGWGGWGRNRVFNDEGVDITITDGLWIIILGTNGWFGLGTWMLLVLLPPGLALVRMRNPTFGCTTWAPALLLASIILCLHAIDSIPNAMVNPVYGIMAGSLTTLATCRIAAPGLSAISMPEPSRRILLPRDSQQSLRASGSQPMLFPRKPRQE